MTNASKRIKSILSMLLVFALMVSLLPVHVHAAEASAQSGEIVSTIITMSDYQNSSLSSSAKKAVPQTIVNAMVKAGVEPELALIGGDYTDGSVGADGDDTSQANLKTELGNLTGILTSAWSGLPYYAIQGNHDYSGFITDGTLTATGAYEQDNYIIYLINEDSFPWWQGSYGSGSSTAQDKATVTATTNALTDYLDSLIEEGDTRPVIIMSHVPMHWSVRSTSQMWYYDNIYANILFEAINEKAKELDILFLFGHNHSSTGLSDGLGYDNEIGDALAFVAVGESMKIPNGVDGTSNYTTETLNFTYMNAGYVGKYNGSTSDCSISALNIDSDSIDITRYTYNGAVYTETIALKNNNGGINKFAYTITDEATGVAVSLGAENSLSVEAVQVSALDDESLYTHYAAYDIALGTAMADGESAKVVLPAEGFTSRAKVYRVEENGTLTEMDVTVSDGAVTFITEELGTYAIAELNLPYVEIPVVGTGESGNFYHVTEELQAGEIYLLVSSDSYLKAIQDTGTEYTHGSWDFETTIATQAMSSQVDSDGEYIQCTDESLMWEAVAGGINGYFYLRNVETGAYLRAGYSVDDTYGRNISTTTSTSENYINFKAVSGSNYGIYAVQNSSNQSTCRWVRYSNSDQWFQGRTSYPSGAVQLWKEASAEAAETIIGVSMDRLSGTVEENASSDAVTGAQLVITDEEGNTEYMDVTVGMLTDSNGRQVSTADGGIQTGLTVTYQGTVITDSFVLNVVEIDESWIALPGGYMYTLDTDGVETGTDNKYIVVGSSADYALTLESGTVGSAAVEVEGSTVTLEEPAAYEFYFQSSGSYVLLTQDGSSTVYHSGGSLKYGSSSAGNWSTSSNGDGTYRVYNADSNGTWYLNYGYVWASSAVSRFAVSSNSRTVRLFKYTGGASGDTYARLYGNIDQSYTLADAASVADVLGAVVVQTSSDRINADSAEIALTSDMVSWNTAFDGSAVGTYTGTVSYCGVVLGTITVTVTGGHTYEAVVIAPTCTEGGYTVYTCTECGDSYTDSYTEALGHDYQSVTVEAACETDGSVTTTCTVCGDSTVEVIPALGHDYEAVVTVPTCTEAGYTTYTCACGDSYVADEVAALGHDYETVTVEATCANDGSITYTCVCGDTYTEVIPATGEHTYVSVTVDATCTENGSVTYTCDCGDSYSEIIEATGHDYEAVITAPTCTENGYTTHTCACGDSYVADEVAALGHDYEAVVTAPTCTEGGYTTYTCACGDTYVADEVAALGHDYEAVITAPTCTEGGYTTYTCACGDSYVADEVAALGHDYEAVITAPTCTEGGYTTYICACGHSYVSDEVAALGHNYETETVEATCENDGSVTTACTVCGETTVEVIPALGHSYETVITEATCTEAGSVVRTCAACGDSDTQTIPAIGHDYEAVTVEATCETEGSVTTTCAVCGDSTVEVIPALGHDYEAVVTAPTCTEAGYTTYTCACGDSYVADEVAALGHDYEAVVTAPTCTENGYTTYTCACGDSYVADEVAALGHDYEAVITAPTCTEAGYTTYTCACGHSNVSDEVAALGHDYEAVVTNPTCTEAGYTTYTCVCGDSYVADETAALGHSYSTEELDGCLVYTCDHCGDTYSESIGWIALPGVYVLDTDGIEIGAEHKYIVVGVDKDYALTLSGSTIGSAQVTVDGNAITLDDASAYEFYFVDNSGSESGSYLLTQDGTKGVYHMGGDMYYGTDNKGYWHIGSASNGSYQLYDYDNLNWYLNYGYVWSSDSVSRFAVSSNARSVRLFKAAEGYVRLSGQTSQTWVHGAETTESAVLGQLLIETSTDGTSASGTAAVTAEMITWDKTFDGYTAGTYTATVTYNGVEIGTVTVTVTGEHVYETTVVAPTCTEAGYTAHACTDCGLVSYTDAVDALGHTYTAEEADGHVVYTCGRCGDSYSEATVRYQQVTGISSGSNYVITLYSGGNYYALSHEGNSLSAVQVTVSDGEITSEITADLLWSYDGSKLSYESNGTTYYLYAYSSSWWGGWWGSATLSVSTSNSSTVSFSSNKLKVGSYYLRYSNGSISANRSASTTYLFVETEE